jgi:hypothetical protein
VFAEFVVVIVMKKIGTAWISFWMLFAGNQSVRTHSYMIGDNSSAAV